VLEPGKTARVDVVVRTRRSATSSRRHRRRFDVWLSCSARCDGRVIFWSGNVADNGKGRSIRARIFIGRISSTPMQPIDKRNAWQARSVLYVHLIPPGAAIRFTIASPCRRARAVHQFHARLNYRKSLGITRNSLTPANQAGPGSGVAGLDHNGLEYQFCKHQSRPMFGSIRGRIPDCHRHSG